MKNKMKKSIYLIPIFTFIVIAIAVPVLAQSNSVRIPRSSEVRVTLKWAAFDADHAAVDYDIEGWFEVPGGYLPVACPISKGQIFDADDNEFTGYVFTSCRKVNENKYNVTQFFYNDFQGNPPRRLEISVGDIVMMPAGDGDVMHLPLIGTYTFNNQFELAPNITEHPNQTSEHKGFSVAVNRVDFTPSMIKVDACLTYPDTRDWIADSYIIMGGQRILIDEWFIPSFRAPETFESPERCYTFLAYSALQDFRKMKPGTILFGIDRVYTNIPECVDAQTLAKIRPGLEKYGLRPELGESGYFCFMRNIPNYDLSSEDQTSLFEYIRESLEEYVIGPAVVEIR
jgi:hypothetical protein